MKLSMLCCGTMMAGIALMECSAQSHPFTVRDDIEMTRFSDPRPLPGVVRSEVAQRSPDGKHFALVTTRGILKSDRLESRVLIFDAADARAALNSPTIRPASPRVIATLVSFTHHQEPYAYASVITDLRWSLDSTCVFYRGEDLNGNYRLYRAGIDSFSSRALTSTDSSVILYDIAGDTIVYRAKEGTGTYAASGEPLNADALDVTGLRLMDILFFHEMEDIDTPHTFALHIIRKIRGVYTNILLPNSSIHELASSANRFVPFSISPDGRNLVELSPVATVPRSWESYEPGKGFDHLRYHSSDPQLTSDTNENQPRQYTLVDLDTGEKRPLIDAPNGFTLGYGVENRVVWTKDGRRILITNTFLPLGNISTATSSEHLRPCIVASVELQDLSVRCLIFNKNDTYEGRVHLEHLSFGENRDEVMLEADISSRKHLVQIYRYHDGGWKVVEGESKQELPEETSAQGPGGGEDLQLIVKQGLNNPPALWVRNGKTGQGRELWDPNPQFDHVRFANVSVYRWKDKTGYEWTGGLVKPLDYIPGKRYPLVLQMYDFVDSDFMTDGDAPTAFVARHLASAGIVVLQIQKKSHTFNDAEAQDHLEGYRSAVEHLSNDGLIDPRNVGVIGFSWTCWYVENALIKAPMLFTAATIADGIDHSYMDYHFSISSPELEEQDDKIIGAKPFGTGLKSWLELAPGFHLDQMQTPLRIEAMTPVSILQEWEIYSSLRMQNKPVDFIYFPQGTHIHQKPLERFESQQGNVDWMRFWLQGYEDPDPAKKAQYERWQRLKELQNAESQAVGQSSNEVIRPN
jgi:hypothetical protein